MFKKTIASVFVVLAPFAATANTISIIGNTTGATGGEFADYTGVGNNASWGDTSKTDSGVTLTISQTGVSGATSPTAWRQTTYLGANSELSLRGGGGVRVGAPNAVTNNAYTSFQLDTGTTQTTLDSFSIKLYIDAVETAAPLSYQLSYASDYDYSFGVGNTYATREDVVDATFIGSEVSFSGSTPFGAANEQTVTATVNSSVGTLHEVRLWNWDGAGNSFHIYEVAADFTVVPEPSSFALLAGCFALSGVALRRRRRA